MGISLRLPIPSKTKRFIETPCTLVRVKNSERHFLKLAFTSLGQRPLAQEAAYPATPVRWKDVEGGYLAYRVSGVLIPCWTQAAETLNRPIDSGDEDTQLGLLKPFLPLLRPLGHVQSVEHLVRHLAAISSAPAIDMYPGNSFRIFDLGASDHNIHLVGLTQRIVSGVP